MGSCTSRFSLIHERRRVERVVPDVATGRAAPTASGGIATHSGCRRHQSTSIQARDGVVALDRSSSQLSVQERLRHAAAQGPAPNGTGTLPLTRSRQGFMSRTNAGANDLTKVVEFVFNKCDLEGALLSQVPNRSIFPEYGARGAVCVAAVADHLPLGVERIQLNLVVTRQGK